MIDVDLLSQIEQAASKATPGRWAMFADEDVFTLMPAMRPGEVATGLNEADAMLIHLLKWDLKGLITAAKAGLGR